MNNSSYWKKASSKHSTLGGERSRTSLQQKGNFRYEAAAIVLVILLGLGYSYYRITKTLEFSPVKLFEKTFLEPIETIKDLRGDSKALAGYDSWIRFNCTSGVTLRNAKEFKSYVPEVGRSWFAEKYGSDPILHQTVDSYEYFVRSESAVGSIANEALLVNKKTHDYFYRTWGI